jgi:hypothetical protein
MSSVDKIEAAAAGGMAAYGVLLCMGCGACYVGGNYERHLIEVHSIKGRRKRAVVEELAGVGLAGRVAEVVRRGHGQTRIDGLGVHDGWGCGVLRNDGPTPPPPSSAPVDVTFASLHQQLN